MWFFNSVCTSKNDTVYSLYDILLKIYSIFKIYRDLHHCRIWLLNFVCLYHIMLLKFKSNDWTSALINSIYHSRLCLLWLLTLFSNKHKWEMKGCVWCKNITGFKSLCKTKAFLVVVLRNFCRSRLRLVAVSIPALLYHQYVCITSHCCSLLLNCYLDLLLTLWKHLLGRCLFQKNGWFSAGSCATGKVCQWACHFLSVHIPKQIWFKKIIAQWKNTLEYCGI